MKTTTQTTTCQICARGIKANTGVIAHHGYQRPGTGWQTASCPGAKALPYEQSRDLIPTVVESYKGYVKFNQEREHELLATPPATLTQPATYYREARTVNLPADFNAEAAINQGSVNPNNQDDVYRGEYRSQVRQCRNNVRDISGEIARLEQRYADWKAPVA